MVRARPYAHPYVAGVALGAVLLGSFILTDQGLGASGAFASVASALSSGLAPEWTARNSYFSGYIADGSIWTVWIVVQVIGVMIGALASAALNGRLSRTASDVRPVRRSRLVAAVGGGALMGVGAALARGCTSGLALSGGAMLSVGAWVFMLALFIAGFAAAPFARRLWS